MAPGWSQYYSQESSSLCEPANQSTDCKLYRVINWKLETFDHKHSLELPVTMHPHPYFCNWPLERNQMQGKITPNLVWHGLLSLRWCQSCVRRACTVLSVTVYQHPIAVSVELMVAEAFRLSHDSLKVVVKGRQLSISECLYDMDGYLRLTDHLYYQVWPVYNGKIILVEEALDLLEHC